MKLVSISIFLLCIISCATSKKDKYFVFRFYDKDTKQQIENVKITFYKIKYNTINNKTIINPINKLETKFDEDGFTLLKYGEKKYGERFGDQKYRIISYNSDRPSIFTIEKKRYISDTLIYQKHFKNDNYKILTTNIMSDSIFLIPQ